MNKKAKILASISFFIAVFAPTYFAVNTCVNNANVLKNASATETYTDDASLFFENTATGKISYQIVTNGSEQSITIVSSSSVSVADPIFKSSINVSQSNLALPLTSIEDSAFANNTTITGNITFPETIVEIHRMAFACCSGITSVNFANCSDLYYLEAVAFASSSNISAVDFTNCTSLSVLGVGCFYNTRVQSIDLNDCISLIDIEGSAFASNPSLRTVYFPSSLNTIRANILGDCNSLESIHFLWNNEQLKSVTFDDEWLSAYYNISSITFYSPGEYIHYYYNCNDLSKWNNVTFIGENLDNNKVITNANDGIAEFQMISSSDAKITNVNNMNSIVTDPLFSGTLDCNSGILNVKEYSNNLFSNNELLYGVATIPSSLNVIEANVFNDCNNLSQFNLTWKPDQFSDLHLNENWLGNLNNSNTSIKVYPEYLKAYTLNATNLGINNCNIYAEGDLSKLITNAIGTFTFKYDIDSETIQIVNINFTNIVTNPIINSTLLFGTTEYVYNNIAANQFQNNTNLVGTLTIDSGVTTIGDNAFNNCSNINAVTVGWNAQQLENLSISTSWLGTLNKFDTAFYVYNDLFNTYSDYNVRENIGVEKCTMYGQVDASCWIENASGSIIITVDNEQKISILKTQDISVTNPYIDSKITINDKEYPVDHLNESLFKDNKNIKGALTIDKGITSLGAEVFGGCSNINKIHLDWSLGDISTMIKDSSINETWLGDLNNGSTLVYVNAQTEDDFEAYNSYQDQLGVNKCTWIDCNLGVQYIINGAQGYCWLIDSTKNVTIIDISLQSDIVDPIINSELLVAGNSTIINSIYDFAFANETHLKGNVNIPSSITSIGANAFDSCQNINSFTLNWTASDLLSLNIDDTWLGSLNNQNTKINVDSLWLENYVNNKSNLGIDQCLIQSTINTDSWMDNSSGTINITYNSDLDMMSILEISLTNDLVDPTLTNTINVNGKDYLIDGINDNLFQNNNYISGNLTIDSSISSIGANVFDGCNNISTITLTWTAEQLNEWFADGINNSNINPKWLGSLNNPNTTIKVPKGLEAIYRQYAEQLGINLCALPAIPKNLAPIIVPSVLGSILAIGVCVGVGIKINNRKKIKHLIRKGQKEKPNKK